MTLQNVKDKKFETQDINLFQIWDEIQRVQANFCFAQEISAYYMSERWTKTATNILDVGTGNGFFLKMLSECFPDKSYTGIDISEEFIEKAKQDQENSNISYKIQDYFNAQGQFDFIIMRLFWQHLPLKKLTNALTKLEKLTKPGSSVLITDSWDRARVFEPGLPEFCKVISAYTKQQIESNRDRNIIEILLKKFVQTDKWELKFDLKIIIPSTVNNNLQLFRRTYDLWIKLFECLGELKIDYTAAKEELGNWKKDNSAYTQAGIRVIQLDRLE
ncbi:MAG: class I SAM-dependent methyltransferase [Desulfobacterales bacterium]|jgi:2-polyprenyl-3-methyl-5-hydroxy-6-metoxy-1,4-benzoquinol methylase